MDVYSIDLLLLYYIAPVFDSCETAKMVIILAHQLETKCQILTHLVFDLIFLACYVFKWLICKRLNVF